MTAPGGLGVQVGVEGRPRPPGRERTTDLPGVPTLRPLPEVTGARPQAEVDLGGSPAHPPHPRSSLGAEAPLEEQGRALPGEPLRHCYPFQARGFFQEFVTTTKIMAPPPAAGILEKTAAAAFGAGGKHKVGRCEDLI